MSKSHGSGLQDQQKYISRRENQIKYKQEKIPQNIRIIELKRIKSDLKKLKGNHESDLFVVEVKLQLQCGCFTQVQVKI